MGRGGETIPKSRATNENTGIEYTGTRNDPPQPLFAVFGALATTAALKTRLRLRQVIRFGERLDLAGSGPLQCERTLPPDRGRTMTR